MKDKRKNFEKLAVHRVEQAVHYIELIGNLSNTRDYEYTEDDVRKIRKALDDAKKGMEERFRNKISRNKFTL